MDTDSTQIAQMIESGEYYRQSRDWYETLYIGPLTERTFFLLIAILASVIAFFAFIAVMAFLPLTDRPGVTLRSNRIDERALSLTSLVARGDDVNTSLINFFVTSYVIKREGYTPLDYARNLAFIYGQSDAPTFNSYNIQYNRGVVSSPAAQLGMHGKKLVGIQSVTYKKLDNGTANGGIQHMAATVHFITQLEGTADPEKTNWTATLEFYYTGLAVKKLIDPSGGDPADVPDPTFKVVSYELSKGH